MIALAATVTPVLAGLRRTAQETPGGGGRDGIVTRLAIELRGGLAAASAALAFALAACGSGRSAPPAPHTAAAAPSDQAWVQLTDRGPEARLITSAATCPAASVDGKPLAMQVRAAANADFPVTVCALVLPKGVAAAQVDGQALPLPVAAPRRIVVFGDTGCRLKGDDIQNCDNPAEWPFATVARLAAAHHPDLVIHVGDYYYRESRCPTAAGCGDSPWGDNWTTWSADFFQPAAPLLAAAPWVIVRGNHEDCARGGPGWFRLLDSAATPLACPATSAPMALDVGGLTLYVLDSSGTDDRRAPPDLVTAFAAQLDVLAAHPPAGPAWIVTHRPIWGLVPVATVGPIGPFETPINATEQAAAHERSLAAVQMVVSGHIHHFATFAFAGERPAQLVAGTGGDLGEPGDTPRVLSDQVSLDGMDARRFGFDRYGFLVLERTGAAWAGDFYDVRDRPIAHCRLVGRALTCQAAPP
jgi:predicted phosphodiesterase